MRQNIVMRDVSNSEDGVSKISRSRSKNNVSAMNKLKEKVWRRPNEGARLERPVPP